MKPGFFQGKKFPFTPKRKKKSLGSQCNNIIDTRHDLAAFRSKLANVSWLRSYKSNALLEVVAENVTEYDEYTLVRDALEGVHPANMEAIVDEGTRRRRVLVKDRQLDIKSPWIAKDPSVMSDLQNLLNSLHNHMAQQPPSSQSSPPLFAPNAPPSQTPSVVPETQIGDSSSMNAIQSALAGIVPGTPSQNLLPLSEHSPSSSPASTTGGADLHNTVAQLLQGGNNSVISALLKRLSGDESQGTDGRKKWPCRSCKQTGHTWARCPQLNVINVIVSLIMSKQEQVNTETNLKRVSDTLLQLGLSPAALGVGNQRDKADNSRNGAAAALAAALTNSLGGTQQGLSHHLAPPLAPVPQPSAISPTHGQSMQQLRQPCR